MNAYQYSDGSDYSIIQIEVSLTSLGMQVRSNPQPNVPSNAPSNFSLQSHLSDIIESIFAWMYLIKTQGLQQWRQEETKRLADTMFRFQEQPGSLLSLPGRPAARPHRTIEKMTDLIAWDM